MCLITLSGLQSPDHKPKPPEDSGRNASQPQDPAAPALRGQVGWQILFYYGNMCLDLCFTNCFKAASTNDADFIKYETYLISCCKATLQKAIVSHYKPNQTPCSAFYSTVFYAVLFCLILLHFTLLCSSFLSFLFC